MFNTFEIEILKKESYEIDIHGIVNPTYNEEESLKVKVDIQPISNNRVNSVYGNYTNYSYEIFMDCVIDGLNTDEYVVRYNNEIYNILSFSVWLGLPGNRTQMLIGIDK